MWDIIIAVAEKICFVIVMAVLGVSLIMWSITLYNKVQTSYVYKERLEVHGKAFRSILDRLDVLEGRLMQPKQTSFQTKQSNF